MRFWRAAVAVSVIAFAVRSIPSAYAALPPIAWPLLQAGPVVLVGAAGFLVRKRGPVRVDALDWAMLLLLAVAATSAAQAVDARAVLGSAAQLGLMFLFLVATRTFRWADPAMMRSDMRWFAWLLVAVHLAGLAGHYTGQAWAQSFNDRYQGLWFNPNYAGITAAVGALLMLTLRRRPLDLVGFGVLGYAMLLSGSRGATVAVLAGLVVLAIAPASRTRMLVYGWMLSVVAVTAALLNVGLFAWFGDFFDRVRSASDPTSGRLDIYALFWARWKESPLLGTGYQTGEISQFNADGESVTLLGHNIYLTVLVELGVVGLAALLGVLFAVWRKSRRRDPLLALLLAVMVSELTESTLLGVGNPIILTLWLCLMAAASSRPKVDRDEDEVSRSRTSRPRATSASRPATG